ncbi:MAG: NUDIX hydrolase, partial [Patescibacteria group bacterium]
TTARRELFEETGINIHVNDLELRSTLYMRYPGGCDFVFYECKLRQPLLSKPDIVLSPNEHIDFAWATLQEAEYMSLIPGEWKRIVQTFNV